MRSLHYIGGAKIGIIFCLTKSLSFLPFVCHHVAARGRLKRQVHNYKPDFQFSHSIRPILTVHISVRLVLYRIHCKFFPKTDIMALFVSSTIRENQISRCTTISCQPFGKQSIPKLLHTVSFESHRNETYKSQRYEQ